VTLEQATHFFKDVGWIVGAVGLLIAAGVLVTVWRRWWLSSTRRTQTRRWVPGATRRSGSLLSVVHPGASGPEAYTQGGCCERA